MIDPDFIIDRAGRVWEHVKDGNYQYLAVTRVEQVSHATLRAEYGPLDCFVWRNCEGGDQ